MKLYYTRGACSLVPRIIINELGLDAHYESVNLKTKETESGQNYLSINPKGAVPVLELDNGQVLTENAVLLQYLADNARNTQLLPEVGDFKRYRVLEWVNYITTEVHKGFGNLFNPTIPQQLKESVFIPSIKAKFSFIDKDLQQYLADDHFTIADAYLFVMLSWAKSFKFDLSQWNNLEHFYTTLSQRDSVKKSFKDEDLEKLLG